MQRDVESLAHRGEGLGLFDGVDAQVGFEVEVEFQHVLWVAGLGGDDGKDLGDDGIGGGRWEIGDWRWGGRRHCLQSLLSTLQSLQIRPHGPHEANHAGQGGVIAQADTLLQRDVERLAHRREGLGLFDGIDAQVGFEVEVEFEHVLWIAGLGGDEGQDLGDDGIGGGGNW